MKIKWIILSIVIFSCFSCESSSSARCDIILSERIDANTCKPKTDSPTPTISAVHIELPDTVPAGAVTAMKQNVQQDISWYLLKQQGLIVKVDALQLEANVSIYLDIQDRVVTAGSEQGLAGFAFHPDFAQFPQVFVYYTAESETALSGAEVRLSRFTQMDDVLDPDSEQIILSYDKNAAYHHGGTLEIGEDGYLYIGTGDDTENSNWNVDNPAQDLFSLKGKLLRLDIAGGSAYSIPPSNPFADGVSGAPEVFAAGLRNPWKFSFDRQTQHIFLADVGRIGAEEINKIIAGHNYGWPAMEGNHCYDDVYCAEHDFSNPLVAFARKDTRCIIGGYVYRGNLMTSLQGKYLSGDCIYRSIWASDVYAENPQDSPIQILETEQGIYTFAEDEEGELYFASGSGNIFKLVELTE